LTRFEGVDLFGAAMDRITELRGKKSLSDDEFRELIARSPPGSHVKLPNINAAGLHDLNQALSNLEDAGERARRAFDSGFYIEVIALRSQSVELFLRLFLATKLNLTPSFPLDDRRTLGGLIADAEKNGFDTGTAATVRSFLTDRNAGLHRYLLGVASYDDLRGVCERSVSLTKAVVEVIAKEFGTPA
jgi:hypothetical protein